MFSQRTAVCAWLTAVVSCVAAFDYPAIPKDGTTPVEQRLAIAGPGAMSVGWSTFQKLDKACVSYGYSPSALASKSCTDEQPTYKHSRTYFHAVTLSQLQPATTVYYKIESTNSTVDHFLSPRPAGDTTPFNLSVVVDLGAHGPGPFNFKRDDIPQVQPELIQKTIGALARTINEYEFILHPGDIAYADDWMLQSKYIEKIIGNNLVPGSWTDSDSKDSENDYQAILETFYAQMAPVSGRKPYMISPGNHEAQSQEPLPNFANPNGPAEGQRNFTDFMNRFGRAMPTAFPSSSQDQTAVENAKLAASLSNPPFWYSFEYGLAHITMINTETDFDNAPDTKSGGQTLTALDAGPFGAPGQQLKWLEADLASVDRARTPWLVVAGHRPWYTNGDSDGVCTSCKTAFEKLFYKYGVDIGVFGHVHNAQRFQPIYDNKIDPNGMTDPAAPMYIISGGAGNPEALDKVEPKGLGNVWAYNDDKSYSRLSFRDRNNLGVEFYKSSTGELLDSSNLYKSHSTRFVRQG